MGGYYSYIKFFHIVSVICWMAGMLYLPRLYVYHCGAEKEGEFDKNLQIMEYKLLYYIMNPSLLLSLLSGILLIIEINAFSEGNHWFHGKLLFITIMLYLHFRLFIFRKKFKEGLNNKNSLYFRIFNETVTLCMVCIVFFVVIKPF